MTPTVTSQVLSGTLAHLQPLLPTSPQELSVRGHYLANWLAQADYAREFDATAGLALGSELSTPLPHPPSWSVPTVAPSPGPEAAVRLCSPLMDQLEVSARVCCPVFARGPRPAVRKGGFPGHQGHLPRLDLLPPLPNSLLLIPISLRGILHN